MLKPKQCASDCCLTPTEQYFSYIIARTGDDGDVHPVLNQHT